MNIYARELWNIMKEAFGKYAYSYENSFPLMMRVFCVSTGATLNVLKCEELSGLCVRFNVTISFLLHGIKMYKMLRM
jgi:hypothetical protein